MQLFDAHRGELTRLFLELSTTGRAPTELFAAASAAAETMRHGKPVALDAAGTDTS